MTPQTDPLAALTAAGCRFGDDLSRELLAGGELGELIAGKPSCTKPGASTPNSVPRTEPSAAGRPGTRPAPRADPRLPLRYRLRQRARHGSAGPLGGA